MMNKILGLISCTVLCTSLLTHANGKNDYNFPKCDIKFPSLYEKLQADIPQSCNTIVPLGRDLKEIKKTNPELFYSTVKRWVTKYNNLGGSLFNFPKGAKKVVYRSSFLSGQPQCVSDLVKDKNVQSVVMLYSGDNSTYKSMLAKETDLFQASGAISYLRVLDYDIPDTDATEGLDRKVVEKIFPTVTNIVKEISTLPGNVLIHCYGGMHRTGILYGVMQKCLNKLPIDLIIDEYRCHTAWQSPEKPGLAWKAHEDIFREFPCEMLE